MSGRNSNERVNNKQIVVVGAKNCGKSTLVQSLAAGKYKEPDASTPVIQHTLMLDGSLVTREFYDLLVTPELSLDKRLKAYSNARAFLVCYSIDDPDSALEVIARWAPEIRQFSQFMPIVLVACKCDLRTEPETILDLERKGKWLVSSSQGEEYAERIGARMYVECSSVKYKGVDKLAAIAMRITLHAVPKISKTSKCTVS